MRRPDVDRDRSEQRLSLEEFLSFYNDGLPAEYPRASRPLLRTFIETHPDLFKNTDTWSLDQHRKRVMDWLPSYLRAKSPASK